MPATKSTLFPPSHWLATYDGADLRGDVLAGLTTAAVVIPQAMAYATIAGLPLEAGLYCALLPMVLYALLGTSRPLSVSTTSTISLLTAQTIATSGSSDPLSVAVTLAALVGGLLVVAGVLRLGFLADFISPHALAGFKIGTGLVIVADQVGKVLGVEVTGSDFFAKVASVLTSLGAVSLVTLALGASSIAALVLLRRFAPGVPGPLVVLLLGIGAVVLLALESAGVALSSGVPLGLPEVTLPGLTGVASLIPAAVGIALISFVESIGAARSFRRFDDPPLDANQELRALGVSSLAGSLTGAYPIGGGLSQTAVNDSSGAATQAAGFFTSLVVLLTVTVIAPLFDNLAEATLGAIVLVAAAGLVDVEVLRRLRSMSLVHWVLAATTLLVVLVSGTLAGVLAGALVSLLYVLHTLNRPKLETLIEAAPGSIRVSEAAVSALSESGVAMLRLVLPVYYANERRSFDAIEEWFDGFEVKPRAVVLEFPAQADAGPAFVDFLLELQRLLRSTGTALHVAALPADARSALDRSARREELEVGVHESVEAALRSIDGLGP